MLYKFTKISSSPTDGFDNVLMDKWLSWCFRMMACLPCYSPTQMIATSLISVALKMSGMLTI